MRKQQHLLNAKSFLLGRGPVWKGQGCSSYLFQWEKGVWYLFRMLSLRRSTAGALVIPFRIASHPGKHLCQFQSCYLLATPTKQGLGTSQGFFSKYATSIPVFLYWSPPQWVFHHSFKKQKTCTVFLSSFSVNLLAIYHECCSLIGYATHYLFCHRQ